MRRLSILSLLAVACGTDPKPSGGTDTPTDSGDLPDAALAFTTTALPAAEAESVYATSIDVENADGSVVFEVSAGALPDGLVLNPAGSISGIPTASGTVDLTLTATDATGATASWDTSLEVVQPGDLLGCGDSTAGAFTENGQDYYGYDILWEAEGGWDALRIQLPPEGTRSMTLHLTALDRPVLWVGDAGLPADHQDTDHYTWTFGSARASAQIHGDTAPGLDDYAAAGSPIQVVLVGDRATDWYFEVECDDAPVLDNTTAFPVAVGAPLTYNANVVGDNADLTWSVEGDLPDWAELDPSSGRIEGVAEEAGVYEFTIVAETDTGLVSVGTGAFSVYEPVDLPCDSSVSVTHEEGYYDGDLYYYYDPRGFSVFQTTPPEGVSALTYTVTGVDGEVSVVRPASSAPFFGSLESREFTTERDATLSVGPVSERPLEEHLNADGLVGLQVIDYVGGSDVSVSVECDTGARLSNGGVPAFTTPTPTHIPLDAVGGIGALTWSATGLPTGVTLSSDGVLSTDGTTTEGAFPIELTLQDSEGTTAVRAHTLAVGVDAACGEAPRLQCGETHTVQVPGRPTALCVVADQDTVRQMIVETSVPDDEWSYVKVSASRPGSVEGNVTAYDAFLLDFVFYGETRGLIFRERGVPDLQRWQHGPMWMFFDAYDDVEAEVTLHCEE